MQRGIKLNRCLKPPFWGALLIWMLRMVDQTRKNGALQFHLKTGEVVICNFETGFVVPEMVKSRPVVVISKSSTHWRKLCTVVPLSTTTPSRVEVWHVLMRNPLDRILPRHHAFSRAVDVWAKCDMITTVCFSRITRPHDRQGGQRRYTATKLCEADLDAVFVGVRSYLPSAKQSAPI